MFVLGSGMAEASVRSSEIPDFYCVEDYIIISDREDETGVGCLSGKYYIY